MKHIEFFFDFISPYSYLAHSQLPSLARRYGYGIRYKPFDLRAAKLKAGNTGPATVEIPAKYRYARADILRWARRYDVAFKFAPAVAVPAESKDSTRANKGVFFALRNGQEELYVKTMWREMFESGGFVGTDQTLGNVIRTLDWKPTEFFAFVQSEEADRLYKEVNQEAHERGVFGAPIMFLDEEIWWGNDRLEFLREYLESQKATHN